MLSMIVLKLVICLNTKNINLNFFISNVVYNLTCSCDSVYIGQTHHNLCARLDDHIPAANSN